jgi:hypothetical protein
METRLAGADEAIGCQVSGGDPLYASMSVFTRPWTSVRRKCRPWILKVRRVCVPHPAMQHGGVQVVDVHGAFRHVVAEVVGSSPGGPALDAGARHPQAEAARMVVAPVFLFPDLRFCEVTETGV